jgi:hypothetical protein
MVKSSVDIHSWAYFFSLALIIISIPLSKFGMSVGAFLLLGMWLWSGFSFRIVGRFFKIGGFVKGFYELVVYLLKLAASNLVDKFTLFFRNKAAMVLASIFIMHVIGLLWTSDMDYALKDLRIKLPLLMFPVVISTMRQLPYREFRLLMLLYASAVFVGTLISLGFILEGDFTDIRDISPFVGSIFSGGRYLFQTVAKSCICCSYLMVCHFPHPHGIDDQPQYHCTDYHWLPFLEGVPYRTCGAETVNHCHRHCYPCQFVFFSKKYGHRCDNCTRGGLPGIGQLYN